MLLSPDGDLFRANDMRLVVLRKDFKPIGFHSVANKQKSMRYFLNNRNNRVGVCITTF